jgi:hypothetical protein
MILRSLIAFSLLAVPQSAAPESAPVADPVPKVVCLHKDGYSAGTAFRVGPNLLVSVNHVTSSGNCQIDGRAIHIFYASAKADFSILSDDRAGKWLKVDCNGFVAGRKYLAIGHARAMDELTVVPMIATGQSDDGMAILGSVFEAQPGQSGGPIVDAETLAVVGTVNAADWENGLTYSVELKGTSICARAA